MTITLLALLDWLLWAVMAVSVGYVFFFAAVSFLSPGPSPRGGEGSGESLRFLVLIPSYHEDGVIRQTVEAILRQDYPSSCYDVAVISDHMGEETNRWLSSQPITLLQPTFEKSSKAQALQFAVGQTDRSRYQYVVVLDADNVVEPDFLVLLNLACQEGYTAIQCHRTAKNSEGSVAVLDGASEEINNNIFRRAHNLVGLSSALIGSGMCIACDWFCEHVNRLSTAGEDKELEMMLLEERKFIKYEESILVRDEKVSGSANFQRQRQRWITAQIQTLFAMLPRLPKALAKGNVNYIDKTLQQALVPRSLLLVFVPLLSVVVSLVEFHSSVKWWALTLLLFCGLFMALPSRLRSFRLLRELASLPVLAGHMVANLFRVRLKDTEFIHTTHTS